jgi:hypothetical protein
MSLEDLTHQIERVLENQQYQKNKLNKIDEILRGNGDPAKGVVVRLALVEQSHAEVKSERKRHFYMAATALLGFAGSLSLLVIRFVWGV